jgi:acetolactate synthase I/II/III large subunit
MSRQRVADHIVRHLRIAGVRHVFCVPGESYLDLLDALYENREVLETVTCRHEAAASHMAEAYAKTTGGVGICLVTRGPGATHASIGVHTARHDSTPMVLFVGQVPRADRGREAFQEVDVGALFAPLAKAVLELDVASRVNEIVGRALMLAQSGRPGPVVVVLPEDVLVTQVDQPDPTPLEVPEPAPRQADLEALTSRLAASERPMAILGGSRWDAHAVARFQRFAENNRIPVATVFRRKDRFDNGHPLYAGELGLGADANLVRRIEHSDLLLVIGARLDENATGGYRWLDTAADHRRLVQVHSDADTIGQVYRPGLAIVAGVRTMAAALEDLAVAAPASRTAWVDGAHRGYVEWLDPPPQLGELDMCEVVLQLDRRLPDDAIVTNGAGNYAAWLHRFYRHRGFGTQLAPTSGAMGYGVPAAIAARLAHPDRVVVALAGDGCFLMSSQELATVAARRLRIVFIVVNNAGYGTIRMHQEARFPGRAIATALENPDFCAYARAFGLSATRVTRTDDFGPAIDAALAGDGPALIELVTDPRQLAPARRIEATGAADGAPRQAM